jgi:hypothetical protein
MTEDVDKDASCIRRRIVSIGDQSPFTRLIAFDFWDGPRDGVLWSEPCEASVRFDFLDWDRGHKLRIFSLAVLPRAAFSQVADLCRAAATGPPSDARQQWWVIWQFPSPDAQRQVEKQLDGILAQASAPFAVVAARDLLHPIIALRDVAGLEIAAIAQGLGSSRSDWFTYLGLK